MAYIELVDFSAAPVEKEVKAEKKTTTRRSRAKKAAPKAEEPKAEKAE